MGRKQEMLTNRLTKKSFYCFQCTQNRYSYILECRDLLNLYLRLNKENINQILSINRFQVFSLRLYAIDIHFAINSSRMSIRVPQHKASLL
jgi:hypothetical protein